MQAADLSPTRCRLDEGLYAAIGADGQSFVLTAERHGRTIGRIRLSLEAAAAFRTFMGEVRGVADVVESTKKLRG
jgi:hypothetical protein